VYVPVTGGTDPSTYQRGLRRFRHARSRPRSSVALAAQPPMRS